MTELFITDGPYDPGAITLADAAYLDLRAKLDAVTAQRDELREAAAGYHQAIAESTQMGSFGRRATALARLVTALEAAQ